MTAAARDAVSLAIATLERHLKLDGLHALDVGCGNGALTRALAARGADAVGVEIDAERVAAAKRGGEGPRVQFELGRAEALPADSGTMGLVVFMHSFHHVPEEVRADALREIARVLAHDGRLHFFEPLPHGPMTEVQLAFDDERETRRLAQRMLDGLDSYGLRLVERVEYDLERRFDSVDDYVARTVMIDPRRAALVQAARGELEARFARIAARDPADGRVVLTQPVASYHFVRSEAAAKA